MSTVKLRIAADGSVAGLWSDAIDWKALGRVTVQRASHVEFSQQKQMWYVRRARARNALRTLLQHILRRPFGEIVHWAHSRSEALAWETAHFGPDGPGWRPPTR
jgi:hypothetical protein